MQNVRESRQTLGAWIWMVEVKGGQEKRLWEVVY